MKKIILPIFCALFALTLSVGVVLASEDDDRDSAGSGSANISNASSKLEAVKAKFEKEREKKIGELESKKENIRNKLEQKKKDLKDKRFQGFLVRIEKILAERRDALNRLDLIAGKIQTRIDKLKAAGTDVSATQAALNACSTTKAAASKAISDSEASVSSIDLNAANAKDLAKAQVAAIQQGNSALKSYHSCLKNAAKSLPGTNDDKGATGSAQ